MRQIDKPAKLHKDQLREMGELAKRFPISAVGEFGRETARISGNRLLQNIGEERFPRLSLPMAKDGRFGSDGRKVGKKNCASAQ
jgi:hypothetical protein